MLLTFISNTIKPAPTIKMKTNTNLGLNLSDTIPHNTVAKAKRVPTLNIVAD